MKRTSRTYHSFIVILFIMNGNLWTVKRKPERQRGFNISLTRFHKMIQIFRGNQVDSCQKEA
ncbi:hypothetical protein CLOLEP_03313 [[Clostridium] leptum DSM 753]|uniref:Uncharacterized protein n=1 Tax=[Clostridium] leptum DSM 753 TaxID=428125 RepID=A7VXI7_9FIRM|nr:hypothetical protein CLOLEP_03313 [[Clostridium] leptum DSM 753]